MNFHFDKEQLQDFKANIKKEWAITNGLGGYAGGSINGAQNRTHQGYLIASLHPPVERYMVFSKTNERFLVDDEIINFETAQHADKNGAPIYTEGQKYLDSFDYDGTVTFKYSANHIQLKKQLTLVQGENTAALAYEITNSGKACKFFITPLMNYTDHNTDTKKEDLQFDVSSSANGFCLIPKANEDVCIRLVCSEGSLIERDELYDVDMQLQTEVDNEVPGLFTHFTPFDICIDVPANTTLRVSLICKVGFISENKEFEEASDDAFSLIEKQCEFFDSLIKKAECKDEFQEALTLAANQFLAYRQSTGLTTVLAGLPWFTDWGRDTMIAYTGLALSTKRFDDARDILITYSKYVKNGLVPNMFPDTGLEPLYNTVDASLWYFYAVYQYLKYVDTKDAFDCVEKEIYPALKEIINAYKTGTLFSIYMEDDNLIHAGSGVDQVTWMDVRVGDWVPTPRHGKPVEINALWYNALCVMSQLANRYGEDGSCYEALAKKVKESFCKKFWNEKDGCLYDVVMEGDIGDDSIRPNQIYAVSLPFTMLDADKAKSVVNVVKDQLYAGTGLRSLTPSHKDYHPIYLGALEKRDAAYHQGTSWGFLLGGFISAYVKVNGNTKEAANEALEFLAPVKKHLAEENCIGSICEIFDGDAPHFGRGCYAQAWSVGEVLRCYTEDILPNLS